MDESGTEIVVAAARAWLVRWACEAQVRAGDDGHLIVSTAEGEVHVAFEPESLKQVYGAALRLARAAGCLPRAMPDLADAEARLARCRRAAGLRRTSAPGRGVRLALPGQAPPPCWLVDAFELAGARFEEDVAEAVFVVGDAPPTGEGASTWRLPAEWLAPGPALLDAAPALIAVLHDVEVEAPRLERLH